MFFLRDLDYRYIAYINTLNTYISIFWPSYTRVREAVTYGGVSGG